MAAVILADPKKKPMNHADRLPREGLTGMGSSTRRHFIGVKQKMMDYVSQQEQFEYDGVHLQPHSHHHHRHHLDLVFADEKKLPKPRAQVSTPASQRKQLAHLGLATPQVDRRQSKLSSRPVTK